jgi:SAM-dependent methyltransferase
MSAEVVEPHNQKAAATWNAGGADYEGISRMIGDSIEHCIFRLAPRAGERVLDLACGTGWASRSIARQVSDVRLFGIDIGPDLVEVAKARAAGVRAAIDYRVADAERLPFEDGYFDAVISTCGIMFAGKPEAAAAELGRVTRPGGRIGLTTWKPDSEVMELFKVMKAYMPAPPSPSPASPFAWGARERVTELLGAGFDLAFEEAVSVFRFASGEDAWQAWTTTYGPSKTLAASLDPERREAFHKAMVAFHEKDRNELGIAKPSKYMLTIGTRNQAGRG